MEAGEVILAGTDPQQGQAEGRRSKDSSLRNSLEKPGVVRRRYNPEEDSDTEMERVPQVPGGAGAGRLNPIPLRTGPAHPRIPGRTDRRARRTTVLRADSLLAVPRCVLTPAAPRRVQAGGRCSAVECTAPCQPRL